MKQITFLICVLLLLSCSESKNDPKAYGFAQDGKSFIKLKGKRRYMAHDPVSLLSNETYEDSIILQIPTLNDGAINGSNIPVEKGYYQYVGEISIQGEQLSVNLRYNNTDDKKEEPLSWNGSYRLVRNK